MKNKARFVYGSVELFVNEDDFLDAVIQAVRYLADDRLGSIEDAVMIAPDGKEYSLKQCKMRARMEVRID